MIRIARSSTSTLLAALLVLGAAACGDDDDGVMDTNLPPVADAGADATFTDIDGNGEHQVTLDGTGSIDADGTIQVYRWSEGATVVAGGPTATPTLAVGIHQLTLEVVDDDGASDTDQVTITVEELPENSPPVADAGPDFSVVDEDGSGDESVSLDGTASTDADGEISVYEWSEGGTVLATGALADVTLTVGTHTITLTVGDDLLATDTDEVVVTVEPQP